ncbi:hypothetical protein [Endozoicomonas montiporae]|nr:hypothetical protein [Endozoicomonas montiporae]
MIGAAATLLLSNNNIRDKLPDLLSGIDSMTQRRSSDAEGASENDSDD